MFFKLILIRKKKITKSTVIIDEIQINFACILKSFTILKSKKTTTKNQNPHIENQNTILFYDS